MNGNLVNGAIYRITYSGWITTVLPIAFIMYSGVGAKIHCLYLNALGVSTLDMVKFLSVVKVIAQTNPNIHPRVLYSIFKKYNRNFIRHSYRTLFRSKIVDYAMISYGLRKHDEITDIHRSNNKVSKYNQASKTLVTNIVNFYLKDKKVAPAFYKPAVEVAKQTGDKATVKEFKKINKPAKITSKTVQKKTTQKAQKQNEKNLTANKGVTFQPRQKINDPEKYTPARMRSAPKPRERVTPPPMKPRQPAKMSSNKKTIPSNIVKNKTKSYKSPVSKAEKNDMSKTKINSQDIDLDGY